MADLQVPHLPPFFNMKYVDEDRSLTPNAQLFNDITYQILNQVVEFFNDGLQFPRKTTAQIAVLGADTNVPVGTVWFSTDAMKLQVKTAASTIETIQSV
jgi:hypothetical protein